MFWPYCRQSVLFVGDGSRAGNRGNDGADRLADLGRRGSSRPFPSLSDPPRRRRLHGKQPVVPAPVIQDLPQPHWDWTDFSNALVVSAEQVFGRTRRHGLWLPYTKADHDHLRTLDDQVAKAFESVRVAPDVAARVAASQLFRRAKRVRSDFKAQCRKRWMTHIVDKLNASLDVHDLGLFYRTLRQIGVTVAGVSREGLQSFSLDELRGQAKKSSGVVDPVCPDLIARVVPQLPVCEHLGVAPSDQEITEALHSLRESAPGKDEVTINMLKCCGPRARWQLRLLIHKMWISDPSTWDTLATHGLAVALYKGTGDRSDLDNFA